MVFIEKTRKIKTKQPFAEIDIWLEF